MRVSHSEGRIPEMFPAMTKWPPPQWLGPGAGLGVWVGSGFMGQIRREALWPTWWASLLAGVTWGQLVGLGPFLNVLPWLGTNPETINDGASGIH